MFGAYARDFSPQYLFDGQTCEDFEKWKTAALPRVLKTLGEFPPSAPVNPELVVEWQHDGLKKQRWYIDVAKNISATLQINFPGNLKSGKKYPAILCCHGHGEFGKDPVMGNDEVPGVKNDIQTFNYNYGHEMAKAGFITFAIDWIGFGERNDSKKPNFRNQDRGRDWCNIYYLQATMLGMTSLSINVAHAKAATGFVCTLPEVNAEKLGVMGLSGGGTMSLWISLCDDRIKATEIIGYSDLWRAFLFRDVYCCGMQVAPGLFRLVELPELQGLLAPRPLLIDIGIHDQCFKIDTAMACFKRLQKIYDAAGATDKLELDLANTAHAWCNHKSKKFFGKYLG